MCLDVQSNPGPDNLRHVLRNISIVNLNVNSLQNKTHLIFNKLGDHDIICITEARLNNFIINSVFSLDNFLNPNDFRKDDKLTMGWTSYIYTKQHDSQTEI